MVKRYARGNPSKHDSPANQRVKVCWIIVIMDERSTETTRSRCDMETIAHQRLKELALQHLRQIGCMARAQEVRCPISRFRVDAAGWLDTDPALHTRCGPIAVVIECKQSRSDFLRDRAGVDRLLRMRDHLERVRVSIEERRIKREEPHLRQAGSTLFAGLDEWDFAASRLPAYRRVLCRLRRIDQQLYGETKFFLMAKYRLADRMYLAAPRGMIRPGELPRGWGLLECPVGGLELDCESAGLDGSIELLVKVQSPDHATPPQRRWRWLRNLAVAATAAAQRRQSPALGP